MPQKKLKEYKAMIWTQDPTRPGQRVTIMATSLDEAYSLLEKEHGKGTVFYLLNEEDAQTPR
ncbi:hypothetical protein LXT21_12520 [Myxococcus sp. K38C18041901]|uniref:hypothetical protein n=1 Tax=Myxococcus guangdongensis TaxID=2906760 RepID=UPI0020A7B9D1|nr:hypothetical protein [Myxococcus guangdongensis]MCP3059602.1 hypothetical protein [Myxococcus guangdongensis]